jgi:hypothetical protein
MEMGASVVFQDPKTIGGWFDWKKTGDYVSKKVR